MRHDTRFSVGLLFLVGWLGAAASVRGEFVELERLLAEPAQKLAEKLGDKTVLLATRDMSRSVSPWPVHIAIAVEFQTALKRNKIDAVRAGADSRLEKLEVLHAGFTAKDAKFAKDANRDVLVGLEWTGSLKPKLKIVAFQVDQTKPLSTEVVEITRAAVDLTQFLPDMNRAVVEFAQEQIGKKVGNGEGASLAAEALKVAGTQKHEIYRWGRELGPHEPWLPGDILQVENFSINLPEMKREYKHQVAIVETIRAEEVSILHQNAFPKGMVVQREGWPINSLSSGEIVAFRPWSWPEPNPYPTAYPARILPPKTVAIGKKINLLKTLDPKLDRVHGIWYLDRDNLRSHRELCCRMQIPVAPPKAYLLSMTAKRLDGPSQLGLGIVVDGHQTMVLIDCNEGQNTGLSLLDGKAANENETTQTGALLPLGKKTEIQCRVEPGQVQLTVDGKKVMEWKGDAARLTVAEEYAMPHTDWLFLSSFNSMFEISSLTLEPITVAAE
jgi:hypothetical protein